jgi:MinD-like ATPase involved in chromosome partitioning or flagellar assembly
MANQPVIGVLSGCGGAGASTLAAVLAGCLAAASPDPDQDDPRDGSVGGAFLLDCDPLAGGIDVLLGCERQPGPRWGQVRLRGGELAVSALRAELPRWGDVSFLASDTPEPLDLAAAAQIVATARSGGPVVIDLPRWPGETRAGLVDLCDLLVLVTAAEVRSVTSSAFVLATLAQTETVAVVRGSSRALSGSRISALLGLEVVGELPFDTAGLNAAGLDLRRTRRGTRRVAAAVIDHALGRQDAA